MSLASHVGGSLNLLEESPQHCITLELPTPVLSNNELEKKYGTSIIVIFRLKQSTHTSGQMDSPVHWKTDCIVFANMLQMLLKMASPSSFYQIEVLIVGTHKFPPYSQWLLFINDLIRKGLRGKDWFAGRGRRCLGNASLCNAHWIWCLRGKSIPRVSNHTRHEKT